MAELPGVYLKPGELIFSPRPCRVTTVLGSCLSVTMFHGPSRAGAICHAVLPSYHQLTSTRKKKEAFHFVDTALEWMIGRFTRDGIARCQIEVKMFGGASMFLDRARQKTEASVGRKNIEMALGLMQREGLRLNAWNVGGSQGRKIIFHTHTGEVLNKLLNARMEAAAQGGKA